MLLNKEHLVSLRSILSNTASLPLFPNMRFLHQAPHLEQFVSLNLLFGEDNRYKNQPTPKPLQAEYVLGNLNSLKQLGILKEVVYY